MVGVLTLFYSHCVLIDSRSLFPQFVTSISGKHQCSVSVLGLGLAAGGVSILYKRIGNWLIAPQFGFIRPDLCARVDLGWTRFPPRAQGSALLQ